MSGNTNPFDIVFNWALNLPANQRGSVSLMLTTHHIFDNPYVSYAEGEAIYTGSEFLISNLTSDRDGFTQYFSDRRYIPLGELSRPFSRDTDPLTVTLSKLPTGYTLTLSSSKWAFSNKYDLSVDPKSGIAFGSSNDLFLTASVASWIAKPI